MGLLALSCKDNSVSHPDLQMKAQVQSDSSILFAKRFSITKAANYEIIHLFGKAESRDTTANFILYQNDKPNIDYKNAYYIKTPCSSIISLSSIYSNMLSELGCVKNIVAIENKDYYNNSSILNEVNTGRIKEVQRNPEIDKEQVLNIKPDVIFAFGMGRASGDFDEKIIESGIPVVISLDHLENTPLARAEWIKFFAAFVNKEKEASDIFEKVQTEYIKLSESAKQFKSYPTVFTELKYSDTWYLPGGKSFMAQLIKDAHAHYLWNNDTSSGSLPLSFEAVYAKANSADFWLNVSMCSTKQQMISQDRRYGDFAAFKNDHVYNNNLHSNALNYSSYWETGMIYPNRILSDLISIFHKEELDTLPKSLYYYKKIN